MYSFTYLLRVGFGDKFQIKVLADSSLQAEKEADMVATEVLGISGYALTLFQIEQLTKQEAKVGTSSKTKSTKKSS